MHKLDQGRRVGPFKKNQVDQVVPIGNKLQPSETYNGLPFNMPTGLSISSKGDIFISDGYGNKKVHKFDSNGELIKSWGTFGDKPGEFAIVHNLEFDSKDRLFVCDRENKNFL